MSLTVEPTPIPDLFVGRTQMRIDPRGGFGRLYCHDTVAAVGAIESISQINLSYSTALGTIRGLHFQHPPHAELKIVRCLRGKAFDVAVDLRFGSPTFLDWYGIELSPDAANCFIIPPGFAHGFQALTDHVELLYLHGSPYAPAAEGGVRFDDPRVGVAWPLPPVNVSERDCGFPLLTSEFKGLQL